MGKLTRINGQSFDFSFGGTIIHADNFSLEITDNSTFAKKDGRPDGVLKGDVEASGEVSLDISEFKVLLKEAKSAGSWQDMPTFDITAHAKSGEEEFKIEAFACNFKIASLLDVDKTSADKSSVKLPYEVTGQDFVKIDGVPYASIKE